MKLRSQAEIEAVLDNWLQSADANQKILSSPMGNYNERRRIEAKHADQRAVIRVLLWCLGSNRDPL